MSKQKVSAKIGKGDSASAPVSVEYDFGDNLEEAKNKFGEDVVWSHFLSSAVIALQSRMRAAMQADVEAGRKPDEKKVQATINDWVLGKKAPAANKVEKASKYISQLSDEEKAKLLEQLRGSKAA